MSQFTHTPPQLGPNTYSNDPLLQAYLKRHALSQNCLHKAQDSHQQKRNFHWEPLEREMMEMGKICAEEVTPTGLDAEKHPPVLYPYDAWQNRIDKIDTHPSWKKLMHLSAQTGIVADGYEKRSSGYGKYARLIQFSKLYLFDAQSAVATCPMAMTDGAAKLLETLGKVSQFREVYDGLTSSNPKQAITAGQHMTELRGGSDVSGATETLAKHIQGDEYELYGFKWFTSAIDAQVAFSLARILPPDVDSPKNLSKEQMQNIPVSLFFMRIRNEDGSLNGITVCKLKDKLGTKALPTAELKLHGAKATLLSPPGRGIACISPMLTITRTWNAVCAVSKMRRMLHYVRDYSMRREAFGRKLADLPAHVSTVAKLSVEYEGCFHLVMDCAKRIGFTEVADSSQEELKENENLLRILTPLAKMYTGKVAVPFISEGLECIGGQGYMEDTGIPSILRNAQVLPIWEGTTNVQALDVLRVLKTHPSAVTTLLKRVKLVATQGKALHHRDSSLSQDSGEAMLNDVRESLLKAIQQVSSYMGSMKQNGRSFSEAGARELAFSLSRIYITSLMLEHAFENTEYDRDLAAVHSFVRNHTPLVTVEENNEKRRNMDRMLAMGESNSLRSKL